MRRLRGARGGALAVTLAVVVGAVVVAPLPAGGQAAGEQVAGLAEARARAQTATAELAALETELGELDLRIAAADDQAAAAEAAVADLAEQVRRLAVDRYMQVDDRLPLPGSDINARERARVLVAAVAGRNLDAMEQYRAERQRLEGARAELEGARAEQSAARAEMADRRAVLAAELQRLEALEAERLEAERREAERRRAEQQEAERREAAQREAARASARATTTVPASAPGTGPGAGPTPSPGPGGPPVSGGWVCPVQGARSFIDSWMAPRAGGRAHQGVDIMSPRGTPVVLPVAGRVSFATGGIGGLTFNLNGDDGNYYYGAHLDTYAGLAPGWYPAGTVVGTVGETGDARGTAPHLHFEIHLGGYGNAVNPYPTTRAHC